MDENLTELAGHFRFGENWANFSEIIDDEKISNAKLGLLKLLARSSWADRTFLDIGCGSGIHSLAAARLGVKRVHAVDIDPKSVATTRSTLDRFEVNIPWVVETRSVFDLTKADPGTFDIVYSWGVLHHTGDLKTALRHAAGLVAPDGLFVFALYRRTRFDWFWAREKRWYSRTSPRKQRAALRVYDMALRIASRLSGRSGRVGRGMDYWHDLHDWLGGYPYESILSPEVNRQMRELGLEKVKEISLPLGRGILGSGCDEYVYRAVGNKSAHNLHQRRNPN